MFFCSSFSLKAWIKDYVVQDFENDFVTDLLQIEDRYFPKVLSSLLKIIKFDVFILSFTVDV